MVQELQILLTHITKELADFLEKFFSKINDDWWEEYVLAKLSYKQQEMVQQYKITTLTSLDLAALLRIFDQNWYEISQHNAFPMEIRNYLKEMQTIRNKWAHMSVDGYDSDNIYRDLDTLQRFASAIGADNDIIEKILELKKNIIASSYNIENSKSQQEEKLDTHLQTESHDLEFDIGVLVSLRADSQKKGVVVKALPTEPENRYEIFIDNEMQSFYASQLQEEIEETKVNKKYLLQSIEKFHAFLSALQIKHPALAKLYSLHAARVDFIPYQFRPVLKLIRSDRPRLLIADGVGVGKTIEAGLILRELQARNDIQSVLIICPRPLVTEKKWYREMRRFDEKFHHLDSKLLHLCIEEMDMDGEWPKEYRKAILPFSLLDEALLYGSDKKRAKNKMGLLELDPPPHFDLVIVDEAHHVRNPETFRHKAVRYFCDNADAVLFLSATPVQLGSQDLFVLLNILRPDLIIDRESFDHMAAPNPYINLAADLARGGENEWEIKALKALQEAAHTEWGSKLLKNNPTYVSLHEKLSTRPCQQEERVEAIGNIESLHTFDSIINRTRRRDIGEFTVRKPTTVTVEFTEKQRYLYENLLKVQTEIFLNLHGEKNIAFMLTTIRRQAASSLYGLKPFLRDILYRHLDLSNIEESEEIDEFTQTETLSESIYGKIESLLDCIETLDQNDPKLKKLIEILQSKKELSNNRVMVFSSFRHTLHYLHEKLQQENFRVALVDGSVPDEERAELRRRFEMERNEKEAIDIMLFSEVGSEGLDYQFCDCIVNYDLPWNPMRIEQRIGRVDRWGQKSESVTIYNMITPGTIDADIYERCLLRIGIFNASLGASEEILGEITESLHDIANNFTLSEKERQEKLQQLADNQIRLVKEQEKLEKEQAAFFGIKLPVNQWEKDVSNASSFWISPSSIENLIIEYLNTLLGSEQEYLLGEKALKTLRLSQDAREKLLEHYKEFSLKDRQWERWLKGGSQHLSVTFDASCASENPHAIFLTPVHPLVKQAAQSMQTKEPVMTILETTDTTLHKGRYLFVFYRWLYRGIKEELKLRLICEDITMAPQLEELVKKAQNRHIDDKKKLPFDEWEALDKIHYQTWNEERKQHRLKVQELVSYRKESLTYSHQARVALLEEHLEKANDEKIRRMRQAQLDSAIADYERHMAELDKAEQQNDIQTQTVAYGMLYVI